MNVVNAGVTTRTLNMGKGPDTYYLLIGNMPGGWAEQSKNGLLDLMKLYAWHVLAEKVNTMNIEGIHIEPDPLPPATVTVRPNVKWKERTLSVGLILTGNGASRLWLIGVNLTNMTIRGEMPIQELRNALDSLVESHLKADLNRLK